MGPELEKYMDDVIREIALEIERDAWKPDQDEDDEKAGRIEP